MGESPEKPGEPWGPCPDNPAGAVRTFVGALRVGAGWLFMLALFPPVIAFALLTLRIGVERWFWLMSRLLGRVMLRIARVRVDVRGREAFEGRRTRIFLINHTSQLDLWVMASIMPPAAGPLGKREFVRIPLIGWAWWALDLLTVDRANPDAARRSMAQAASRLRKGRGTVIIAPEGTRSRTGELGPFKMGAFHLAAEVGAPIIPVIIRGAAECQPMGQVLVDPGVVRVEVLPEIPTDDYPGSDLHDRRDAVREVFVRALAGQGDAE